MNNEYGRELKKIRIRAGLTQKDMAEIIGVPMNTYKSWEYGTALPNFENREKVQEQFQMPYLDKLWERKKLENI